MNIIKRLRSRSFFSVVLSVVLSVVFVSAVVNAATTISTNITTEGTMGVGSTSPWGLLGVESTSSADASTPIFVVGDQGTSTPFIYVSGNDGSVGIGSTTPSAAPLGVVGDAYISSGLGVGTVVTSDGRISASTDFSVASTSLWGQVSIEAGSLSGDAPIFVIGDEGTSSPMFYVDGNMGNIGIGSSSPSATGLGVVGDAYISSGLGVGTVVTSDGRISASTDFSVASTSLWGQVSIEAGSLSGDAPIFVVSDEGTSTPSIIVDGNDGDVGIATTSSQEVLNVGGDAFFGSSATTTIVMDSSGTDSEGACLQMRGADGTMYRAYIMSTTTGDVAEWRIDAGLCQ